MKNIAYSLLASALLASTSSVASETPKDASLHFSSKDTVLIGVSYGLNSVDGQSLLLDERITTRVSPGRREISYTCPNSPGNAASQVAVINFAPGEHYELVCRSGQPALISNDGC